MNLKPICGGVRYQSDGENGEYIGMPVVFSGLPQTISVESETLTLKSEHHITLVYIGKVVEKYDINTPDFIAKVTADFCEFVKEHPIALIRYRDEFRFVEKDERHTIVVMADVSNLSAFFDRINEKYGLRLEPPPTHVTLYTLQPNIGISIPDSDVLTQLSKVIPAPIKL